MRFYATTPHGHRIILVVMWSGGEKTTTFQMMTCIPCFPANAQILNKELVWIRHSNRELYGIPHPVSVKKIFNS